MKKEKESGTLLGVGTAYLPVKEIKGEFYVKVSDFTRCMDSMRKELEEENKKLKSGLAFERTMLDNVKAEYKSLQNVKEKLNIKVASLEGEIKGLNYTIEKLKEENQTLELWLDNKEKLNEEYRKQIDDKRMELSTIAEETIADLQSRIKELEENEKYRHSRCMKAERQYEHSLGDDELIYEEGLYD